MLDGVLTFSLDHSFSNFKSRIIVALCSKFYDVAIKNTRKGLYEKL